jgi:protein gp37
MSGDSKIEWTDATWNPVRGCRPVSDGCDHCYAARTAIRMARRGGSYHGLVGRGVRGAGPRWKGRAVVVPKMLDRPLRWTRPRMIFVNSMSDLFHSDVPFEFIAAVLGVCAASQRHTFQILTKRPKRMSDFIAWVYNQCSAEDGVRPPHVLGYWARRAFNELPDVPLGKGALSSFPLGVAITDLLCGVAWPLPNVWWGVSVENQINVNRVGCFVGGLAIPRWAKVRFVSYEPGLGPIDLRQWFHVGVQHPMKPPGVTITETNVVDWIIVGGESGPYARPFDLGWAIDVVKQAQECDVPVFVKQMGETPVETREGMTGPVVFAERRGRDPEEWPCRLQVQEYPRSAT